MTDSPDQPMDGSAARGSVQALVATPCPCARCGYELQRLPVTGQCPECGTPIAATVPPCPRCLHTHRLWRPLSGGMAGPVRAWECRRCGGAGFDPKQLRAAVEAQRRSGLLLIGPAVHDLVAQSPADCGRCRRTMAAVFIDDTVLVDRCDGCGFVWLDEGELAAVAAWMNRHAPDIKTPRDFGDVLGDGDELARRNASAENRRDLVQGLSTPLALRIAILILRLIARV